MKINTVNHAEYICAWAKSKGLSKFISQSLHFENLFYIHKRREPYIFLALILNDEDQLLLKNQRDLLLDLSGNFGAVYVCSNFEEVKEKIDYYLNCEWDMSDWQYREKWDE